MPSPRRGDRLSPRSDQNEEHRKGAKADLLYHWAGIWNVTQNPGADITLKLGTAGAWAATGKAAFVFPCFLWDNCCAGAEVKHFPLFAFFYELHLYFLLNLSFAFFLIFSA